jgi:hypothetical protein
MAQITTIPAREFARDLAGAKRATHRGPVLITDRGRPAYALLRIDDYYRLADDHPRVRSLLGVMQSLPGTEGIEWEPERLSGTIKAPNFDES